MIKKFNKLEEENSSLAKKINEIIDWINEQEKNK